MPIRLLASLLFIVSWLTALGASYFACPNSTQYVYLGSTLDQVIQTCGTPSSTTNSLVPNTQSVQQTQWVYNYKQWSGSPANNGRNTPYYQPNIFVVNFNPNLTIASISVSGQEVQATNFYNPNMPITVGKSTNLQVRQLCGQPSIIQTISKKTGQGNINKTVLTYPNQPNMPVITLTFENNQLINISP